MIRKLMASSALIALLSAGAISIAQAQTDPANPPIVQDNAAAVPDNNAEPTTVLAESTQAITPEKPTLASAIIGKSVYSSSDPESDNIGDVNDLIVAEDGSVTHAVVGVGGFLGIGEKNVAVPFDELKVVESEGDLRLVYSATKEQLEAAPAFDRTAYDPAARGAPAATDTTGMTPPAEPAPTGDLAAAPPATDTTGTTPPVEPEPTGDLAAAPNADTTGAPAEPTPTGDMAAAPAADETTTPAEPAASSDLAAAPATDDQTAASGSTAATSDQMAASDTTATTTDQNAGATAPAAQDFVQKAAIGNKFEVESSKLALEHAQNEDVKNFAQRMIDEHTKAGDDLKAAVQSVGITVPEDLDQAHQDKLDQLQAANTDFDRQFVDMQVQAHDDAVKLFEDFAQNGDDANVRQFAETTLPTLKDHQKMIQDISDNLGSAASTAMATDSEQPAATTTTEQPADATATATAPDSTGQEVATTEQPADATATPPASDSTGEQVVATEQPADATTTAPATESAAPAGDLAFINASADQVRANWLIGKSVYGPDDQSIGDVNDLVLQKDTGVRVALIDVGGFLGIGEKTVAIPFTDLQFTKVENSDEPQVTVAMSKDQLNSQPAFDTSALDNEVAANAPAPATTDNTTADNAAPGDPMAPADPNAVVTTDPMAPATTDQAATPDTTAEITTGSVPPSQDLAASKLIGATVYASDDSNIGEVGDIVFDKKGDIDAIVVDVGGFLGIGEKPIALNFEQLNMRVDQNGTLSLVANASKDQLNNAPAFETTVQ